MMKGTTEVTLETILISVLNVAIVYLAAFTYRLEWSGVLTVMILASLFTAVVTHFVVSKIVAVKSRTETLISEGLGIMGVAILSAIAVLVILTRRFNFPQALGISLLSGILSSLIRHMMS
jgi:hypothetical protein